MKYKQYDDTNVKARAWGTGTFLLLLFTIIACHCFTRQQGELAVNMFSFFLLCQCLTVMLFRCCCLPENIIGFVVDITTFIGDNLNNTTKIGEATACLTLIMETEAEVVFSAQSKVK